MTEGDHEVVTSVEGRYSLFFLLRLVSSLAPVACRTPTRYVWAVIQSRLRSYL